MMRCSSYSLPTPTSEKKISTKWNAHDLESTHERLRYPRPGCRTPSHDPALPPDVASRAHLLRRRRISPFTSSALPSPHAAALPIACAVTARPRPSHPSLLFFSSASPPTPISTARTSPRLMHRRRTATRSRCDDQAPPTAATAPCCLWPPSASALRIWARRTIWA